jgi:hypothetical protein
MAGLGTLLPIWNVRATVAIRGKAEVFCSDGALPGLTQSVVALVVNPGLQAATLFHWASEVCILQKSCPWKREEPNLPFPRMGSDHAIGGHRTFKSTGMLYFCQS